MENSDLILTVSIVAIVMLLIWGLLFIRARRVNLIRTPKGEKPEWMSTTPPPETVAAIEADGKGMALYDHDQGENVAAPFAEQIEDILRAQMSRDPKLQSYEIDFGTGPDGTLEIRVGDKSYTNVEQIPDERLRAAVKQAVATYNERGN
jgi:hypothetical protein